jgi:uncharacterized phiE125 gp8 family phage protein
MPLTLVTAPAAEPFADATLPRLQLRLTGTDQDSFFTSLAIPAARDRAEAATRRQLISATWDLVLDRFPSCDVIELPKPPLQSVTWIKYVDTAGTLQTWSAAEYLWQAPAGPRCRRGRIEPAYGYFWPSVREQLGAVQIRFVAGYGAAGTAVPTRLLQAMLQDIGGLYEFREGLIAGAAPTEIPSAAAAVYRSFRSLAVHPIEGVD